MAQQVKSHLQSMRHKKHGFNPWVKKISWRGKWQPTPVFMPGKFHGRRSLLGYSPWGCKESDTTERLHFLSLSLSNTSSMVDFKPQTWIWEDVSLVGSQACVQASSSIPLIQATLLNPESTSKDVSLRLGSSVLNAFLPLHVFLPSF